MDEIRTNKISAIREIKERLNGIGSLTVIGSSTRNAQYRNALYGILSETKNLLVSLGLENEGTYEADIKKVASLTKNRYIEELDFNEAKELLENILNSIITDVNVSNAYNATQESKNYPVSSPTYFVNSPNSKLSLGGDFFDQSDSRQFLINLEKYVIESPGYDDESKQEIRHIIREILSGQFFQNASAGIFVELIKKLLGW